MAISPSNARPGPRPLNAFEPDALNSNFNHVCDLRENSETLCPPLNINTLEHAVCGKSHCPWLPRARTVIALFNLLSLFTILPVIFHFVVVVLFTKILFYSFSFVYHTLMQALSYCKRKNWPFSRLFYSVDVKRERKFHQNSWENR